MAKCVAIHQYVNPDKSVSIHVEVDFYDENRKLLGALQRRLNDALEDSKEWLTTDIPFDKFYHARLA